MTMITRIVGRHGGINEKCRRRMSYPVRRRTKIGSRHLINSVRANAGDQGHGNRFNEKEIHCRFGMEEHCLKMLLCAMVVRLENEFYDINVVVDDDDER